MYRKIILYFICDSFAVFNVAIIKSVGKLNSTCKLSPHFRVNCYLIPDYFYSLLFPLTPKLQQQLASIGITELTCGEHIYQVCRYVKIKMK